MWDDQKRQRFQELREPNRQLNAMEQAELAALVQELEDMEAAYLKPANERLRQETARLEERNRHLESLIKRRKVLAQRLQNTLQEALAEECAIESELASVIAERQDSDLDD
jgi:D-serine dehydratase